MSGIGLALGGGGARGLAHIGIIRALRERQQYVPSIVVGTSAGSIVATLFAAGVSQQRMEAEVRRFEWFRKVVNFQDTFRSIIENRHGGLVSNKKLEETVNEIIEHRSFDQIPKDLAVVSADIEFQRRVLITSSRVAERMNRERLAEFLPPPGIDKPGFETVIVAGYDNVGRAVAASCAIPGLFRPVDIDGLRLVDGAIVDQVPVDVVKAMGAETTIGVSLSFAMLPDKISGMASVFSSMLWMLGTQQLRRSLDSADLGFQIPGIDKRSIFDTRQFDLIDIGEREMARRLPLLEAGEPGPVLRAINRIRSYRTSSGNTAGR